MAREAVTMDADGPQGADQVQDVVLDQDQEDDGLLAAFEEAETFADEEERELERPGKRGKGKAKAKAADDDAEDDDQDDDAEDDDDQEGDEDEDDDEADPRSAKKRDDAEDDDDQEGDFVEHEGQKIAVRDLVEAHKFKSEVTATVDQIRTKLSEDAGKALEEFRTKQSATMKELEDGLAIIKGVMGELEIPAPPKTMLDPNSDDYDPDGYQYLKDTREELQAKLNKAKQALETGRKTKDDDDKKARERTVGDNIRKLLEKAPELRDQAKAKAFSDQLRTTLKGDGFTDEEINNLTDYRQILLVRDAMAHRAAKAKGAPKIDAKRNPPRLVRAGARAANPTKGKGQGNKKAALDRLQRTGKVAASDLENIWGDFV